MTTTIEMPALEDVLGKIKHRQDELGRIFQEAGPNIDLKQVTLIQGDTSAKAEHIRKLNDELDDLGKERDELTAVKRAAERVRTAGTNADAAAAGGESGTAQGYTPAGGAMQTKGFGDLFIESKAHKDWRRGMGQGPSATLDVELKTVMSTGAGFSPETFRTGRLVDFATRPVQVADVVPQTTTSQAAVVYMEETTFTNNAAEVAESTQATPATYPEAAFVLTEQSVTVRKIGVWVPVTDEQMEDVPQIQGYLNNRLPFMIRQRLDSQILVGNGTAPNIRGFLNTVGIQTQAKGADTGPDAVYKAIVKVRTVGFGEPNAVVYNPTNWQDVRLLRTADGIYIWGNPADAGPERIWGLNVVQAVAETLGTALVGDFQNFSEFTVRRGIEVQVSNSHDVFFVQGKQAVRADMRGALVVYRPSAFCTVTGL